ATVSTATVSTATVSVPTWSAAAVRPRETPAAWAASRARIASGSRMVDAAAGETLPGTSRLPGRRIGSPASVTWRAGFSATRSAASQPASISLLDQALLDQRSSSPPEVNQFDRSVLKIGGSDSPVSGIGVAESRISWAARAANGDGAAGTGDTVLDDAVLD